MNLDILVSVLAILTKQNELYEIQQRHIDTPTKRIANKV